jgi:uncharacterized membrane protein
MIEFIYSIQIALLITCLYMIWRARRALNGLGRGLSLLIALLVVRRFDDIFGVLDGTGVLILSSAVVAAVTYDIYKIYKTREVYETYLRNRRARITELEQKKNW